VTTHTAAPPVLSTRTYSVPVVVSTQ